MLNSYEQRKLLNIAADCLIHIQMKKIINIQPADMDSSRLLILIFFSYFSSCSVPLTFPTLVMLQKSNIKTFSPLHLRKKIMWIN